MEGTAVFKRPGEAIAFLVAALVLSVVCSVAGIYMGFKLGLIVGGAILAGLAGAPITSRFRSGGLHEGNYLQTVVNSVTSFTLISVILAVMAWNHMPDPGALAFNLHLISIGFFGVGLGMMLTPLVVDRWKLSFPHSRIT